MKLKSNWGKLSEVVYENIYGDRIHVNGIIRIEGNIIKPNLNQMYFQIKLFGGNTKRALMYTVETIRKELEI